MAKPSKVAEAGARSAPDLGFLDVTKIIVHDVPKRRAADKPASPIFSEVESPSNTELRNFVRERVIDTLATKSFPVRFTAGTASPLPGLIDGQLGDRPKPFVKMSQDAAQHLYLSQDGTNPAGLLVVLRGKLGSSPAVGIMKLEREEAIRLNQDRVDGKRTFSLEHLRDLMLSKKTRVFKTGLFWKEPKQIHGVVCDMQLGRDLAREVANFFLQRFLGCELADEPSVVTKRFWDASERFINDDVPDPAQQTEYLLALTTEMVSQKSEVDPRRFATEHIKTEHRDAFNSAVTTAGIARPFPKDIVKIESRVRQVQYEFASGLRLTGPTDVVRDRVSFKEGKEGQTQVAFEDRLKGVHGKGR